MMSQKSPLIAHCKWGRVTVAGVDKPYRDVKLFPGGSRTWNWKETDTHHDPGIQIADVQELLEHGADVVVLSKGYDEVLKTMPETVEWLTQQGIEVHVLQTGAAVEKYNALVDEARQVGALIHSTC